MAYADYTYYNNTYKGEEYEEDDVNKNLEIASNTIDLLSNSDIVVDELNTFQLKWLKMANCMLAEHYLINGHTSGEANQISLLSFSYSGGKTPEYPKMFKMALARTGLINRSCLLKE